MLQRVTHSDQVGIVRIEPRAEESGLVVLFTRCEAYLPEPEGCIVPVVQRLLRRDAAGTNVVLFGQVRR